MFLIRETKKYPKRRGFTLVETIVTISIFTLLALGVTTLFVHIFVNSRDRLASLDNIDQARLAATNFTNEIRIAQVGNDGAYPINQADDNQIIFYSNYKQATGTIARIRYYLATSTLYRGITIPTGSPLYYDLDQETIKTIQTDVENVSTPIFYYYDGNYTGSSTPLTQPININDIKYIKISLDISKKSTASDTGIFNVTTGASIRNLKTNLGN